MINLNFVITNIINDIKMLKMLKTLKMLKYNIYNAINVKKINRLLYSLTTSRWKSSSKWIYYRKKDFQYVFDKNDVFLLSKWFVSQKNIFFILILYSYSAMIQ